MILVDSCGWISWLTGDARAHLYAPLLESASEVVVPTLVLTEVVRFTRRERGEATSLTVAGAMQQCLIVPLDAPTGLLAALVGLQYRLAMADAIIYAHALTLDVPLMTSNAHFTGLSGVTLLR